MIAGERFAQEFRKSNADDKRSGSSLHAAVDESRYPRDARSEFDPAAEEANATTFVSAPGMMLI